MSSRSWTAALPGLYDACMAPLERTLLRRWRGRLWEGVPRDGVGLEIGAGSGANHAWHAARHGLLLSDLQPAMLRRYPRAAEAQRGALRPPPRVAADVGALPLPDGSLDWAVATLVFCEVGDPLASLREVRRALRPNGTLHLLEHVRPHGLAGRAAAALTRLTGPLLGEHFDRRTHELLGPAGFEVTALDRTLHGALVLLRASVRIDPSQETAA